MNKGVGVYLGIAFELTGLIIVFLFIGKYFDEKFTLGGIGITVGILLAFALWITHLLILVKKWEKQDLES